MFNIIAKRNIFFIIPAVIIIAGIVGLIIHGGFNMGIDFKGGTQFEFALEEYNENAIRDAIKVEGVTVESVVKADAGGDKAAGAIVTTNALSQEKKVEVENAIIAAFFPEAAPKATAPEATAPEATAPEATAPEATAPEATAPEATAPEAVVSNSGNAQISTTNVSASMGKDLWSNAAMSIIIAVILMLIYITFRFELLTGLSAILALIHDVLIMLSVYAIFDITINTSFIAAILTILGYSINATIVVFDRIRENSRFIKKESFVDVANKSIWQTIGRSINTTVTTLITLVALYILGVASVKEFALPLIVGVVCGCYSSVFLSSQFWVLFKGKKATVVTK